MVYYIRNKLATAFIDTYLGLEIPAKVTTNEGIFAVDTNNIDSLLRAEASLYTILTAGTDGSTTYGTGIYVSADGSAGENKVDIGAAGATAAAKGTIAYRTLREELASTINFVGTGTNYLTGSTDVQAAIVALDTQVDTLASISDSIQWRPQALLATADTRFSAGGTIAFGTGATIDLDDTPLSDDELPTQLGNTDLTEGSYILFSGATDRLYKVVGTNVVEQTATAGLNEGYTYIVTYDLLDSPDSAENQAIYTYSNADLIKLSDIDWGTPSSGGKTYASLAAFTSAKSAGSTTYTVGEPVYIADINRFVEVLTTGTGIVLNTDYALVGGTANALLGTDFVVDTTATAAITSAAVTISADTSTVGITGATGATVTATTGTASVAATAGEVDLTAGTTVDINAGTTVTVDGATGVAITSAANDIDISAAAVVDIDGATGVTINTASGDVLITADDNATMTAAAGTASIAATVGEVDLTAATLVDINGADVDVDASASVTVDAGTTATLTGGTGVTVTATTGTATLAATAGAADVTGGNGVNIAATTGQVDITATAADVDVNAATAVTVDAGTTVGITGGTGATVTATTGNVSLVASAAGATVDLNADIVNVVDGNVFVLPTTNASTAAVAQEVAGATIVDSVTGLVLAYDATRTKWISIDKQLLQFGSDSADGQYLAVNGVVSGLSGFLMPRNAVITGCTIISNGNASNNPTKTFEIRASGLQIGTDITLTASGNKGTYSATNLNINVAAADYLQIFADPTGQAAQNIVAVLEIGYYVA